MKRALMSLMLLLFGYLSPVAQTATVSDPIFAGYLQSILPNCITGNQLNGSCPDVLATHTLNLQGLGITSLAGIEAFVNLNELDCRNNNLTALPALPPNIYLLQVTGNGQLTSFPPALPANLMTLEIEAIGATSYPQLPVGLLVLKCGFNPNMGPIPALPPHLGFLYCTNNQLTSLPTLPSTLTVLDCRSNQISSLPALPASLQNLYVQDNLLTSISNLPIGLHDADASNNQIACWDPFPQPSILTLRATGNPFTCVPNYPQSMDPPIGSLPLCTPGNLYGCANAAGIGGRVFADLDSSCTATVADAGTTHAPLKLYDNTGTFVQAGMSHDGGDYFFTAPAGTWRIAVDTVGKPYQVVCAHPGADSTATLTAQNPLALGVTFPVQCKPGFDVGVLTVNHDHILFPGETVTTTVMAGDLSHQYGLHCAAGLTGQVQVTIAGPVSYAGAAPGARTPTVAGNVLTYAIADFDNLDIHDDLRFLLTVDTTATAGDSLCISVNVTPTAGDYMVANNTDGFCFSIVNSLDPNFKEVFPSRVAPGYDDWLDYTIHFQNTGNAPAMNIRLQDTLNENLDWETIEFLSASHAQNWSLVGNVLTVRFPNIMLPDSASDPAGSQGHFQFRMKPKSGLGDWTYIFNKASIYFDFNPSVVTNIATVEYSLGVGRDEEQWRANTIQVYPNPSAGIFNVSFPENWKKADWKVTNLLGQELQRGTADRNGFAVDLTTQPAGYYLLQVGNGSARLVRQIVKR